MSIPRNQIRLRKDIDNISNLPDTILCLILSFLPTKSVVKTSILSKRWRYVWSKVPALDFTEMLGYCNSYESLTLEQKICFKSFVDRVLVHNDVSHVLRFCIDLYGVDAFYVNSWLNGAARREIRELNIYLRWKSKLRFCLPPRILCGGELVILKLKGHLTINAATSLHFPKLETIRLKDLRFADNEFMRNLLSNCPVLRELRIVKCKGLTTTFHIESLMLKLLKIKEILGASFVIKTPNLRYLCVHGKLSQFDIEDMNLLNETNLSIRVDDYDHGHRAQKLLSNISGNFTEGMKVPVFQNLTCLQHEYMNDGTWRLLNSAPSLKSLIIEIESSRFNCNLKIAPAYLPCLESVDIHDFYGKECEIDVLAYILKAAPALKEVNIEMVDSGEIQTAIFQKLLSLPRSSAVCQVNVTVL